MACAGAPFSSKGHCISTIWRNEAQRDQHPPSKHQAEVGTNADLENYKALQLFSPY